MPGLDERIGRALRASAQFPGGDQGDVARAVERKKARRQTRRNAATGALVAAVLVTTAVVTVAIVRRDGGDERRIATPPSTTAAQPADPVAAQEEIEAVLPGPETSPPEFLSDTEALIDTESARGVRVEYVDGAWQMDPASACRIDPSTPCGPPDVRVTDGGAPLGPEAYSGTPASVVPVRPADSAYARGPVVTTEGDTWFASYDRVDDTYRFPPSHLVDLRTGVRVDLQGEILSFAQGEGALWAVTRDEIVDTDGTEYRLKRIEGDAVHSEPIPPGQQPVGDVVVGGGSAWVPVSNGVLRFDVDTGAYRDSLDRGLGAQDRRAVAVVGGRVWLTNGSGLLRIDPTAGDLQGDFDAAAPLDTAQPLTHLVSVPGGAWALAGSELLRLNADLTVNQQTPLPAGLQPSGLSVVGSVGLVAGVADLAPVSSAAPSAAIEPIAVLFDGSGITSTVVVAGGRDAAIALDASYNLLLTSGGYLFGVELP